MKKILVLLVVVLSLPSFYPALADENIYHQRNNPANFIRLEDIKESEAEEQALNHPYVFNKDTLADILRSVRYSRKLFLQEKIKQRYLFEEEYIEQYVPYLIEALSKASPFQKVVWSLVQKRPLFIIRDDRLTKVRMWVKGEELYIQFLKSDAKLQGDYQASVTGQRLIDQAKGLRIELDPQEGQKFSFSSDKILIFDLKADWAKIVARIVAEEEASSSVVKKGRQERTVHAPVVAPVDTKNAEDRLAELKRLKDKGLISSQDYEKKKTEILKEL